MGGLTGGALEDRRMEPTARRRLGGTALELTVLGFGAAPIGGFRATMPDRDAVSVVDEAWDQGVRLFDTSPFYGYGRTSCGSAPRCATARGRTSSSPPRSAG